MVRPHFTQHLNLTHIIFFSSVPIEMIHFPHFSPLPPAPVPILCFFFCSLQLPIKKVFDLFLYSVSIAYCCAMVQFLYFYLRNAIFDENVRMYAFFIITLILNHSAFLFSFWVFFTHPFWLSNGPWMIR